jgi:hypothetical protein
MESPIKDEQDRSEDSALSTSQNGDEMKREIMEGEEEIIKDEAPESALSLSKGSRPFFGR